jgi:signal transduction histidine kinase
MPDLQAHTMLQLYKIAQEAVSNAIKHGKATQVAITLAGQEDQLTMTIKNDGLPFAQPMVAKNRMGLRIMNYRANTIGATLDIKPLDKSGTLVTCVLPIKNGSKSPSRVSASTAKRLSEPAHAMSEHRPN